MVFWRKKISGSAAISYAMLIFFVVVAMVTNFTLLSSYHAKVHIKNGWKHRLITNMESGMALVLSENFEPDDEWINLDLFGDETDSVMVRKFEWGLFDIGLCKSHVKKLESKRAVLIGSTPKLITPFALQRPIPDYR